MTSSTTISGALDKADNTAITTSSSAPDFTQIPIVHEFGHFKGLNHPGKDWKEDCLMTLN